MNCGTPEAGRAGYVHENDHGVTCPGYVLVQWDNIGFFWVMPPWITKDPEGIVGHILAT